MYVTFRYERAVRMIYQRTRCMRKESKVMIYIPREFHGRYDDLAGHEYRLRKFENYQTRIKWGYDDLELYKRLRGAEKWEKVALPDDLQKVNMNPRTSISLSPAQGRPDHSYGRGEKRERGSPSGTPGQANQKSLRQDEEVDLASDIINERTEAWSEILEKADLVGEATITPTKENQGLKTQPDTGLITSITCTPAKPTFSIEPQQSPIISKLAKNTSSK